MSHFLALPGLDHQRGFAICALLTGILSVLLLALNLQGPSAPAGYLAFFDRHRGGYIAAAIVFMTWAVVAVIFVVAVEQLLRRRGETLARAAAVLSSVGVLLLAFGYYMSVGALLSISTAGTAPLAAEPEYQARIWRSMSFILSDPGLMAWGLGFVLFGRLAWNSGVLPNWVAALGMLGGVAGLLTLAVYQTPVMAVVQVICFAIWGFAVCARMIKSSAPAEAP
jgi:hypothetical protein